MPPRSPAALLGIGRARFLLALLLASAAGSTQADICRTAPTASGAANGGTWADAMTLPAALAANTCTEIWLQQGQHGRRHVRIRKKQRREQPRDHP